MPHLPRLALPIRADKRSHVRVQPGDEHALDQLQVPRVQIRVLKPGTTGAVLSFPRHRCRLPRTPPRNQRQHPAQRPGGLEPPTTRTLPRRAAAGTARASCPASPRSAARGSFRGTICALRRKSLYGAVGSSWWRGVRGKGGSGTCRGDERISVAVAVCGQSWGGQEAAPRLRSVVLIAPGVSLQRRPSSHRASVPYIPTIYASTRQNPSFWAPQTTQLAKHTRNKTEEKKTHTCAHTRLVSPRAESLDNCEVVALALREPLPRLVCPGLLAKGPLEWCLVALPWVGRGPLRRVRESANE